MYAEIADVERLMAQFNLSQSTKPSREQVESIIADTEHEVNVMLDSASILIPIDVASVSFLGFLKMVVSYGATAAILKSMFPSIQGPGDTPAYAFWESRYNSRLKGIIDGTLVPSDVIRTTTKAKPSTYFTRNPGGEESLGVHEPWFKRSMIP